MTKALAIFDTPRSQLPSHVADFFKEESNIAERNTVPSLSYEGKVWTVSINGQKTKLMKRDENGDETAVPVMRVVILDYNKKKGRTYYEGAYDPAKPGTPLCWSEDGVTPNQRAQAPQASSCATCPWSVKGSKTTEQGKQVTACSQHRMIAVVPANNLDAPPLRMKLALTSLWDINSPDQQAAGWYAFDNYLDLLRTKGVPHSAGLVTKMKFDPNTAYPKVLFSADRWLEDDEMVKVREMTRSQEVKNLLGGTFTPDGVNGTKMITTTAVEVKKEPVKPQVVNAVAVDDEDDIPDFLSVKPAKAAKPVVIDMDDEDEVVVAKPKKAKVIHKEDPQPVEEKKAAATKSSNADLDDILSDWGE
jgi:hypothetical protein